MKRILAGLLWLSMMGAASAGTLVTNDGSFSSQNPSVITTINVTGNGNYPQTGGVATPFNVQGMNSCAMFMGAGVGSPTATLAIQGSIDSNTFSTILASNSTALSTAYTNGNSLTFPLLPPVTTPTGGFQVSASRGTGISAIEVNVTSFSGGTSFLLTLVCSTSIMPSPNAGVSSGTGASLTGDVCGSSTSTNVASVATLTVNTITAVQALAAGKTIYVCGFSGNVVGTAMLGVQLFSSSSGTCASGNTLIKVVGGFPTGTTQINWDEQGSPIVQTASGQSLCIEVLATTSTASQFSVRIAQE